MKKDEIISQVRALNFPRNSYIVFGSAPLAVAGLREANDIDFLVSTELFEELKKRGWEEVDKGGNNKPLVRDNLEVHNNWSFGSYNPTLEQLLNTADVIDEVPLASLEEVLKWKTALGRPKDLADIELIKSQLAESDALDTPGIGFSSLEPRLQRSL